MSNLRRLIDGVQQSQDALHIALVDAFDAGAREGIAVVRGYVESGLEGLSEADASEFKRISILADMEFLVDASPLLEEKNPTWFDQETLAYKWLRNLYDHS